MFTIIGSIATAASALIAAATLAVSIYTQKQMQLLEIKRTTIKDFNHLQNEVLDKLALTSKDNAQIIVDSKDDNAACKEAYNDYRTLLARLEHFSVGIKEGVYDFEVVRELAGSHLYYLYEKVDPIIQETNKDCKEPQYYTSYIELVKRLEQSFRETF